MTNERLIIVGSYEKGAKHFEEYKKKIESALADNIKILHWVNDSRLKELYSNCTGFITTSEDEDFGITPIEAMASGKPVIAPNEGGFKESIIDNKNGVLIEAIDTSKIISAVENIKGDYSKNIYRAEEFDVDIFINKIKRLINQFNILK